MNGMWPAITVHSHEKKVREKPNTMLSQRTEEQDLPSRLRFSIVACVQK